MAANHGALAAYEIDDEAVMSVLRAAADGGDEDGALVRLVIHWPDGTASMGSRAFTSVARVLASSGKPALIAAMAYSGPLAESSPCLFQKMRRSPSLNLPPTAFGASTTIPGSGVSLGAAGGMLRKSSLCPTDSRASGEGERLAGLGNSSK